MNIHEEEDGIFEERQALMVSPRGKISTLRKAHFLKPTVKDSINGPDLIKLPFIPLCSESSWPISVSFNGWYDPLPKWPKWVENMRAKYENVWKQCGIFEALLGSCCKIKKNQEVVFGVAERWCCETNTFLFQWAEATITLEDVLVLGGFSVLGQPFSMPLENQELVEVKERLEEVMKVMVRLRKRKGDEVSHGEWMEYFMDSGDVFEHEAFLVLWLSRNVLSGNVLNAVNKENFSIAIYLARGIKIALAPPVLASLYRDLSLLKQSILVTAELNEYENNYVALTLWSPIQFVQIWAWERLPPLQPKCMVIPIEHPRLARWDGVNWLKRDNVRWVIDAAGDSFIWRPYAIVVDNWLFPEFYKNEAQWALSNGSLSEEFETYARCLRVSELVGTDSVEAYLPHRVAMQFGMDQDIPQWFPKSNATPETAWENYNRPACDAKLYFPSRLFEGEVTTKYLKWWEKSVVDLQGDTKGVLRGLRSSTSTPNFPKKRKWGDDLMQIWRCNILDRKNTNENSLAVNGNCLTSSPKPKSTPEKKSLHSSKTLSIQDLLNFYVQPILAVETNVSTPSTKGNHPDVPPGSPPKCDRGKEMLNSCNMQHIQNNVQPILAVETNGSTASIEGNHPNVFPGFLPKCDRGKDILNSCNMQHIQNSVQPILAVETNGFTASTEGNHPDVPPNFPPKCIRGKEILKSCDMQHIQYRSDVDIKPFVLVKNDPNGFTASTEGDHPDVLAGFPPKCDRGKEILKICNMQHIQNRSDVDIKPFLLVKNNPNGFTASTEGNRPDVPPGFPPKCDRGKEILKSCNMQHIENRPDAQIKPFQLVKNNQLLSSIEGDNDDVPPGFTPKSEQVKEISQGSIEEGCEFRQIYNDKPFLALKKQCSSSSAEGNGYSRMTEELLEPMVTKQSEATIRTSERAAEIAYGHDTRPERSIQSEGGINFDEGSNFFNTKFSDLDMNGRLNYIEKMMAEVKAALSGSMGYEARST